MISDLRDDAFGVSNGGLYVHNDFIKKYPDLTKDVVNAVVKATDFIEKNKQKWVERTMNVIDQSAAVAKMAVDNCQPSVGIPMGAIRQISKARYELGIQKDAVTAELPKFVDYSFLEKATAKRGKPWASRLELYR